MLPLQPTTLLADMANAQFTANPTGTMRPRFDDRALGGSRSTTGRLVRRLIARFSTRVGSGERRPASAPPAVEPVPLHARTRAAAPGRDDLAA